MHHHFWKTHLITPYMKAQVWKQELIIWVLKYIQYILLELFFWKRNLVERVKFKVKIFFNFFLTQVFCLSTFFRIEIVIKIVIKITELHWKSYFISCMMNTDTRISFVSAFHTDTYIYVSVYIHVYHEIQECLNVVIGTFF